MCLFSLSRKNQRFIQLFGGVFVYYIPNSLRKQQNQVFQIITNQIDDINIHYHYKLNISYSKKAEKSFYITDYNYLNRQNNNVVSKK